MIYQILPLFKPNELQSANEYLSNYLIDQKSINIISGIAIDNMDMSEIKYYMRDIINEICKNMYGINSPQIANFIIVQNFVYGKLKDSLLNYMKYTGLDGNIIDWYPSYYISSLIAKFVKENGFKPSEKFWDPNKLWDFQGDIPQEASLVNPINGFMHMTLILKNIDNSEFLLFLNRNGILSSKDIENDDIRNKLEIKLLPYNNFNKVLNIANAIFKYY